MLVVETLWIAKLVKLAPACPVKIVCGNFVGLEMLMLLVDITFILSYGALIL